MASGIDHPQPQGLARRATAQENSLASNVINACYHHTNGCRYVDDERNEVRAMLDHDRPTLEAFERLTQLINGEDEWKGKVYFLLGYLYGRSPLSLQEQPMISSKRRAGSARWGVT